MVERKNDLHVTEGDRGPNIILMIMASHKVGNNVNKIDTYLYYQTGSITNK